MAVKPDLTITVPEEFPLCDDLELLEASTVNAQFPNNPGEESPPFCMCLPENDFANSPWLPPAKNRGVKMRDPEFPAVVSGDLLVQFRSTDNESAYDYLPVFDIRMVQTNVDCCEPELHFEMDADIVCMPLEIEVEIEHSYDGTYSAETWKYVDIEAMDTNQCKWNIDLSVPAPPKMNVVVRYSGTGVTMTQSCSSADVETEPRLEIVPSWEWDAVNLARVLVLTVNFSLDIPRLAIIGDDTQDLLQQYDNPSEAEAGVVTLMNSAE